MSTRAYQGRTTVSELKDLIRKLGGTPKGNTKAQLQDQLEQLIVSGGSGSISQEDVAQAVAQALAEQLPDAVASAVEESIQTAGMSEEDMDDIFGD